jgi:YbgC/YbaW family acyl-CoA thioester hydrolase
MVENRVDRTIMWGDLDSLGIVFYPRYYEWIDAASHLFFESIGLNMGELWEKRGILFGLGETSCRYMKAGRYHQRISIITGIASIEIKTVVFRHTIEDASTHELMVEGMEKRICMNVSEPTKLRTVNIPGDISYVFREAMKAL